MGKHLRIKYLSKDGNLIRVFHNISEASIALSLKYNKIYRALRVNNCYHLPDGCCLSYYIPNNSSNECKNTAPIKEIPVKKKKIYKLSYDECKEVVSKYNSLYSFRAENTKLYQYIYRNGWMGIIKEAFKMGWDKDSALEECKKYNSLSELSKSNHKLYAYLLKEHRNEMHSILGRYTHVKGWHKSKKNITAEEFLEMANFKFNNKFIYDMEDYKDLTSVITITCPIHGSFRQRCDAHLKSKFACIYCLGECNRKRLYKWDKDKIIECAKNCSSYSEFIKKHHGCVKAIRRLGLNEMVHSLFVDKSIDIINDKIDNVYAYIFEDLKTVYVGRTIKPLERDNQHRTYEKSGTLLSFSINNNVPIPKMSILYSGLTLKEGLIYEDEMIKVFSACGYTILNKAKTGLHSGSLGGIKIRYISKKDCIKYAKYCDSCYEFMEKYRVYYDRSRTMGWLKDMTWFSDLKIIKDSKGKVVRAYRKQTHEKLTKDICTTLAKECKTVKEFRLKHKQAYVKSLKVGWLKDYTWLGGNLIDKDNGGINRGHNYWTIERCIELAKKYKTRSEFGRENAYPYNILRKKRFLDEVFPKNKN